MGCKIFFNISVVAPLVLTFAITTAVTSPNKGGQRQSGLGDQEEDCSPEGLPPSPTAQPKSHHMDLWILDPATHEISHKCEEATIDWSDVENARKIVGTKVQLPVELVHKPSEGHSWAWKDCGTYGSVDVSVGYRDDHPDGTRSDVLVGLSDLDAAIVFLKEECCTTKTNCRGGDYVISPEGGDQEVTIRLSKSNGDNADAPNTSKLPQSKVDNVNSSSNANAPDSSMTVAHNLTDASSMEKIARKWE